MKRPLRGISILKFSLVALSVLLVAAALVGYKPRPDFLSTDDAAARAKLTNTAHHVTYSSLTGKDGALAIDATQAVSHSNNADIIQAKATNARLTTGHGDVIVLTGDSSTIWTTENKVLTKGSARMHTNRDFDVTADSLTANFNAGTLVGIDNVVSVSSYGTIRAPRLDAQHLTQDSTKNSSTAAAGNDAFTAHYSGGVQFHACPGCTK